MLSEPMDVFDSLPEASFSAMLRLVLEKVEDSALILDRDLRILFANDAFQRTTGITEDEIRSGHWRNNINVEILEEIRHALQDGAWTWKGVIPGRRSSGFATAFQAEVFALDTDGEGQVLHYAAVLREVSELDQQMAMLQDSVVFLEQLMDAIPNAVSVKDPEGRYLTCNRAYEELTGMPRHRLVGRRSLDLGVFDPAIVEVGEKLEKEAAEGRPVLHLRGSLPFADGREIEVLLWVVGFHRRDGSPGGTIAVFVDITDLREKERELAAARERAEAETRSKTMFVANMSHEIRTPLNALVGLSHLLSRMELGSRQREHAEKIQMAGLALQSLVDDILDFSRMEMGRVELNETTFRMAEVMRMLDAVLGDKARSKGLSMVLEADPELVCPLRFDKYRLVQVLVNLVGNGVKFTSSGAVETTCRVVDRTGEALLVRFSVTDSGIGMNPAQMRDLFQPFHQADASITRRFGGTGLGLSISKRLVGLMGGDLQVRSEEGVGSTFHFDLWIPRADELVEPENETSFGGGVPDVDDAPLRHLRILLADDDRMNRETSADLLAAEGANVLPAANGREVLDILHEEHGDVDLVLMDIEMPVLDGVETTRRMRADPMLARIPVVAMTAHAFLDDWKSCQEAGMVDHVVKPFEIAGLRETILRWTGGVPDSDSVGDSDDAEQEGARPGELDREQGMRRHRGNGQTYAEMLLRFLREQDDAMVEIGRLVERGARIEARARARALRAACGIVGAIELQRRARVLELGLGADVDVSRQLASASRAYARLSREILAILEERESEVAAASAEPPDEEALGHLLDLLRHSDGGALDQHEAMLPVLRAWLGSERAGVLDAAMRAFDFDRALRLLDGARLQMKGSTP